MIMIMIAITIMITSLSLTYRSIKAGIIEMKSAACAVGKNQNYWYSISVAAQTGATGNRSWNQSK